MTGDNLSTLQKLLPKQVLLQEVEKEVLVPYSELLERFGVACLIRIPEAEFVQIAPEQSTIGHFNLGATIHEIGKKYLLVRIVRHGAYKASTKIEVTPPLLSLAGARIMRCLRAEHRLSLTDISAEYFKYSYAEIVDRDSLVRVLHRRYSASRLGLTVADIAAEGVAFTLLRQLD